MDLILDFLGLIVATLIILIQEFLKDRIKKNWIKVILLGLIIGSFFYSGFQVIKTNKAKNKTDKENVHLIKQIDSLKITNNEIKSQNDTLLVKVDLINNRLSPFILIAKDKYPNLNDNEALDMLKLEIRNIKKSLDDTKISIKDAKISTIDKKYIKYGNGVQAQLIFHLTNKNIRDKIVFEIYLPDNSKTEIIDLEFLETVGLSNFNKGISDNKKSAFISFNFSGSKIPSFGVNLTSYSQFLIKSNYLEKNVEIK